jgi:hypothetical protein
MAAADVLLTRVLPMRVAVVSATRLVRRERCAVDP